MLGNDNRNGATLVIYADRLCVPFLKPLCEGYNQLCSEPLSLVFKKNIDRLKFTLQVEPFCQVSSDESDYFSISDCYVDNPRIFCVSWMMFLADICFPSVYCCFAFHVEWLIERIFKTPHRYINNGFDIVNAGFYNDIIRWHSFFCCNIYNLVSL